MFVEVSPGPEPAMTSVVCLAGPAPPVICMAGLAPPVSHSSCAGNSHSLIYLEPTSMEGRSPARVERRGGNFDEMKKAFTGIFKPREEEGLIIVEVKKEKLQRLGLSLSPTHRVIRLVDAFNPYSSPTFRAMLSHPTVPRLDQVGGKLDL